MPIFPWRLVLVAAYLSFCCLCCSGETPHFRRDQRAGLLYVQLPNVGDVVNITVTIWNDSGEKEEAFIAHISADGTWKTVLGDIVENDVIYYLIVYQHAEGSYTHGGLHHFFSGEKERELTLGSERYLRRRATTVFHDDFTSGRIDPSKWTHDIMAVGRSSGHFQMWTPEKANSYVQNGILYIRPTLTVDRFGQDIVNHGTIDVKELWGECHPDWGGDSCITHGTQNRPIMSALLRSSGTIRYGRVEVEAQLPKGDWLWPAIWMMPKHSRYGGWPRSGEIDIMEAAGNLHLHHPNGQSVGVDCDQSTIHYGTAGTGSGHARQSGMYRVEGTTFGDGFHTYWLDWTESYMKIGVDSHTVLAVSTPGEGFWKEAHLQGTNIWAEGGNNAPFDQPFYLILNVAVGGGFFWDGLHNSPYPRPWSSDSGEEDFRQFWQGRHLWLPTWRGDQVAMKVRSVTMRQY
ncbi:beta-1,3-glucan-binding protein-like [Babylonia areolata]|uniref:beta-1,3-glucan-binding protein-like n=1 Tax=Babylonia areolata TaxID=304850 RepID=UPI003FD2B205